MITGLKIAARAPDTFGRLIVLGLVILIVSQSFINIGAMLGLLPLTGEPLIFVSQGGSALLFGLVAAGIILNVSRHETKAIK
jgi:cell division protein FtsW